MPVIFEPKPNFDFTLGYVPKLSINALKYSMSANNIILKRVGAYVSLEKGLNSDYFSSTLGATVTIHKYVYLWAGIGSFAKSELFDHIVWNSVRKEMGIGFTPYKWVVVRIGWSKEVGSTATAGIKIPIKSRM